MQRFIIRQLNNNTAIFPACLLVMATMFRFPCDSLSLSMTMLLQGATAIYMAIWIIQGSKILSHILNPWLGVFLFCSIVSTIYPFYSTRSCLTFINICTGLAWMTLLSMTVEKCDITTLYNGICIAACINLLWMILQMYGKDPLFVASKTYGDAPIVGLMGNRNFSSAFFAFCFPAFLRKKWAWLIPVVIFGLFLSKSGGGPIAVMAGIAAYFLPFYIFSLIFIFSCIWYILLSNDAGMFERLKMWRHGIKLSAQHWAMGSGIGHWGEVFKRFYLNGETSTWYSYAHNEYIQGFFEMGISFIVCFIGFITNIISRIERKSLYFMALVIIFVNCMINFPMHVAPTAMIALTWIAIFEISTRKENGLNADSTEKAAI